jgi:hypothetical protein
MKVGIMQPYFFPYIGYWQLINVVDKFVIYDDVNFIKGGWINRNRIILNNEVKMVNIKMKGASSNRLINEIELANDEVYNKKLLKTIENSYIKSPYFDSVYPLIWNIINNEEYKLSKFLEYLIQQICKYLSINTEIVISSEINKNNNLKGQDKVLAICKELKADVYINAFGGVELYSKEVFLENGMELNFIKSKPIHYRQFNNEFVPWLSIIDVLMFNDIEKVKHMLKEYDFV